MRKRVLALAVGLLLGLAPGGLAQTATGHIYRTVTDLSDVELERTLDAGSSAFNRLDEILNPRIARFGLRITF